MTGGLEHPVHQKVLRELELSSHQEKKAIMGSYCHHQLLSERERRQIQGFLGGARCQGERQQTQAATKEIQIRHEEKSLSQRQPSNAGTAAQRGWDLSICGDVQNLTEQESRAASSNEAGPASSGQPDKTTSRVLFQPKLFLDVTVWNY